MSAIDPRTLARLQQAFAIQARRYAAESPLAARLCQELAAGLAVPGHPVQELFSRYFRMTSTLEVSLQLVPLLLGALHERALAGAAPPLPAAVQTTLRDQRDELLDFMLSHQVRNHDPQHSAGLLPGFLLAARRFGGGLFLLELGAGGGLNLLWDQYHYTFETPGGPLSWGPDGGPEPAVSLAARLEAAGPAGAAELAALLALRPPVVGRIGLDPAPLDLTQPGDLRILEAFTWPDDTDRLERLRAAAGLLQRAQAAAGDGAPRLQPAGLPDALPAALAQAYAAMPAGHTLLLCHAFALSHLPEAAYLRTAAAVQSFSARLQPGKPLAWLQLEHRRGGGSGQPAELRLFTFSDQDPEDREERLLATVDPAVRWLRWVSSGPTPPSA